MARKTEVKKRKGERKLTFIDLFAGCGGLSEVFIQVGYFPVAHVEIDQSACYALKTQMVYRLMKGAPKREVRTTQSGRLCLSRRSWARRLIRSL